MKRIENIKVILPEGVSLDDFVQFLNQSINENLDGYEASDKVYLNHHWVLEPILDKVGITVELKPR